MQTSVLLFGITRDIVGERKIQVEIPDGQDVSVLMDHLETEYPRLAEVKTLMIAVNEEYALKDRILQPNDEVALIPPVSGG